MPRHTLIKPPPAAMRALLAFIAALLVAALVPTSAPASVAPAEPVADAQVDAWLGIARAWWGRSPDCPEGVQVVRAENVAGDGAWASAETPGCRMSLDPDFYPRPAAWSTSPWGRREWQRLMCNVVAHEWGHLLGHGHASDPDELMAPITPFVVTACRTTRPRARAGRIRAAASTTGSQTTPKR